MPQLTHGRRPWRLRLGPVLALAVALLVPGCVGSRAVSAPMRPPAAPGGKAAAKYVILLIGDGMPLASEVALSRYLYGTDQGLTQHGFPFRAACTTWDVTTYDCFARAAHEPRYAPATARPRLGYDPVRGGDRTYDGTWSPPDETYFTTRLAWGGGWPRIPATDSASAATALACGCKTDDGNIAWLPGDPPGGSLPSLGETARAVKSMAYGVVTTVPFSHATPAAFISHNINRNNYLQIAAEAIRSTRPDVVIGAGHPTWSGNTYISAEDCAGLNAGTTAPYNEYVFVQRIAGQDGGASLQAATDHILDASHPDHGKKLFGLFGGKDGSFETPVPAAAPGSPGFSWSTNENPTLAQASTAALRVLTRRGGSNGFFLMIEGGEIDWANHDRDYRRMVGAMYQFDQAVKAVVDFVDDPATPQTWDNTLVVVTADHANGGLRFAKGVVFGRGDLPEQTGNSYPGGEVMFRAGGAHTNEPVMLYVRGAGLDRFREYAGRWYPGTQLVDNTQVYQAMKAAMGLP